MFPSVSIPFLSYDTPKTCFGTLKQTSKVRREKAARFFTNPMKRDLAWAEGVLSIVELAVTRRPNVKTAEELLDFLAGEYHELMGGDFGLPRISTPDLAIHEAYYQAKARQFLQEVPATSRTAQFEALSDEPIDLTTTRYINRNKVLAWTVVSPAFIPDILAQVNRVYQDVLNPDVPLALDRIVEKVGLMHYLLAHAMPYERGSAAIADMFSKTILDSLGIKTAPWKPGIAPDKEAFSAMPLDYAKNYHMLFQLRPTY